MGNAVPNCCDTTSSRLSELTLTSPKACYANEHPLDISQIENLPPPLNCALYEPTDIAKRLRTLQQLSKSSALELTVINEGNLPKHTRVVIGPQGMRDGLRQEADGCTYFGSKKKHYGKVVNDYVVPLPSAEDCDSHRGSHFLIHFNTDARSYWLRDLGKSFGVFLRLDYALALTDNMMINAGASFVVVNILDATRVSLRVFSGNEQGKTQ